MNDKLIEYSWLEEFGDSSHVSLHCYRLAYSKGWSDRDKEISAITQENEELKRLANIMGSGWALVEYNKLEQELAEVKAERDAEIQCRKDNHDRAEEIISSREKQISRMHKEINYCYTIVRRETAQRCAEIASDMQIKGGIGNLASTRAIQFQVCDAIRAEFGVQA